MNDDKDVTEGQALFLIIAIFFGGTFLLNAIVYGLFMSLLVFWFLNTRVKDQIVKQKFIISQT